MKKAVVLFSGGLDSSTVLALAKKQGFDCYPISFNYGQKHSVELIAAKIFAESLGLGSQHKIINLDPFMFGPCALNSNEIEVPRYHEDNKEIPPTYVPARNTIFLSIALGYAESIGASDIFLGVSFVDYSGYPDCRPEYIQAFETLANLATRSGVCGNSIHLHAPLLYLSKAETIKIGIECGVKYENTVSCYNADVVSYAACGVCDSCVYRKKGFVEAGLVDPTIYKD